jgi:hypothetical protein
MNIIMGKQIDWLFRERDQQAQGDKNHRKATEQVGKRESAHRNYYVSSFSLRSVGRKLLSVKRFFCLFEN